MTDKQVGELDILPQVLPYAFLWGTFLLYEITSDLNVRAVDDGKLGPDFLDQGNKTGHLRVIYSCCKSRHLEESKKLTDEGNIDTTRSEWPTIGGPSQTVLQDPGVELCLCFVRKAQIGSRNALQDVVVVLRRTEYAWGRVWNIPNGRQKESTQHPCRGK